MMSISAVRLHATCVEEENLGARSEVNGVKLVTVRCEMALRTKS